MTYAETRAKAEDRLKEIHGNEYDNWVNTPNPELGGQKPTTFSTRIPRGY